MMPTPNNNLQMPGRDATPSNAIVKSLGIGTPVGIIGTYAALKFQQQYNIPIEVTAAAISLLLQATHAVIAYTSKGGRKGETQ